MSSNEWKFPLNLAVGFHVLIALAVVFLPRLLTPTERIEETYTVNLINMADLAPATAPAAKTPPAKEPPQQAKPAEPPPPPPPKPIKQPAAKKVVEQAIALDEPEITEPTPVAPPAPPEAISIKPSKHKVKPDVPPPPPPPKKVEPELRKVEPEPRKVEPDRSQQKRQKLAEMIRAEQQAAEEARALEEEAELEKRLAEATLNRMKSAAAATREAATTPSPAPEGPPSQSNEPTALEKQYYAAIMARLQAFWSLPEYKDWDPAMKATIVITVEQNGQIAGSYFESQSGDKEFDRLVTKTLQDVGHLPPIPAAINKNRLELGVNFTPGGIR